MSLREITDACLPSEMVEEILCNLPVQSLLRFGCVCKSWHSLISNPLFIKKHLARGGAAHKKVALIPDCSLLTDTMDFYSCPLPSTTSRTDSLDSVAIHHYFQDSRRREVQFLGSFDGLFCIKVVEEKDEVIRRRRRLKIIEKVFLWNPSLRKILEINSYKKYDYFTKKINYGVGFDSCMDDYVVLKLSQTGVDLYSLKNHEWRRVGSSLPHHNQDLTSYPCSQYAFFLNKSFHWLSDDGNENTLISLFHLSDMSFAEIQLPEDLDLPKPSNRYVLEIAVFRGKLCLIVETYKPCDSKVVLWEMGEYGVKDSWTEIFAILNPVSRPFYVYENGGIMMLKGVEYYNNDYETALVVERNGVMATSIVRNDLPIPSVWCQHVYMESLVPPV